MMVQEKCEARISVGNIFYWTHLACLSLLQQCSWFNRRYLGDARIFVGDILNKFDSSTGFAMTKQSQTSICYCDKGPTQGRVCVGPPTCLQQSALSRLP